MIIFRNDNPDGKKKFFLENRLIYADNEERTQAQKEEEERERKKKEEEEKARKAKEKENEAKKKKKEKGPQEPQDEGKKIEVEQKVISQQVEGVRDTLEMQQAAAPEADRQNFKAVKEDVERINENDRENNGAMRGYLGDLVNQRKLTKEQAEEIYQLEPTAIHDPKHPAASLIDVAGYEKKLQALCGPIKGDKTAIGKIFGFKRKEMALMREFQKSLKKSAEILERNIEKIKKEAKKELMLKQAARISGIRVEKGVPLQYHDHSLAVQQTWPPIEVPAKFTQITDITWDEEHIVEDEKGNVLAKYNVMEPKIHIKDFPPMTLGRFTKWVNEMEVTEQIASKSQMENNLGLNGYGITLEEGTVIEYMAYDRDEEKNVQEKPQRVKIATVTDEKIILDRPVEFMTESETRHESFEAKSVIKKDLTFGEFAKWFRKRDAWKQLDAKELQEHLNAHNRELNARYERDGELYPPIQIKDGAEFGYSDGSKKRFKIEKVEEDGSVTLNTGDRLTPTQFWNRTRKNELEKYDPELYRRQATQRLEKEDPARAAAERELMRKMEEAAQKAKPEEAEEKEVRTLKTESNIPPEPPRGILQQMWTQTTFLSMKDLWTFGETIVELIGRKHQRRTKGRIGKVGANLPWVFGTEFDRMKQSAENDEVNQYKESMANWGVFQIRDRLNDANSTDEAKACFFVLAEKGHIRWDDEKLWKSLNRLRSRYGGPKYITKIDDIEANIDYWWGQNQYQDWYNQNTSTYDSNKKKQYELGKQLETDFKGTGGVIPELQRLIETWERGEYVDSQQFEGLLDYIILYGKGNAESKIYYFMKAVTARHPKTGLSLVSMDRIGSVEGDYLNRLPMLDFLVDTRGAKGVNKTTGRWEEEDFKRIIEWIDSNKEHVKSYGKAGMLDKDGKPIGYNPGANQNMVDYVWNRVLPNEWALLRLEKGLLRNPGDMDHDDVQLFLPWAGEHTISQIAQTTMGKPTFTGPGWANAYPGYAQALKSLSREWKSPGEGDRAFIPTARRRQLLANTLASMVRFDAIMDNRFERNDRRFFRLSESFYDVPPISDLLGMNLRQHQRQLQSIITGVAGAYGDQFNEVFKIGQKDQIGDIGEIFIKTEDTPAGKAQQMKIQNFFNGFDTNIRVLIKKYGGAKIEEVIQQLDDAKQLKGVAAMTAQQKAERKAQAEEYANEAGEQPQASPADAEMGM